MCHEYFRLDILKDELHDIPISPICQGVAFLATMLLVVEFGVIVFLFLILFRIWRLFDPKDKHQTELFGSATFHSFFVI